MTIYAVDTLMAETRRLAAEYYRATTQTLPVGAELARYDAMRILNLIEPTKAEQGVDALDKEIKIQIKSRVIFDCEKGNYRIGQISVSGAWQRLVLVLYNSEYEPQEIYACERAVIEKELFPLNASPKANKRGPMTVAKFKKIGTRVWVHENFKS